MHERALARMQELTRRGHLFLTVHAEEELAADGLTVHDVESVISSGRVTKRQKDAVDFKYVIVGSTTASDEATVVCQMVCEVVVITVFLGTL